MTEVRANVFEQKMLDAFKDHNITDVSGYLSAIEVAKNAGSGSVSEAEFEKISLNFGVPKRLFGTYAILIAKAYEEHEDDMIQSAYINPSAAGESKTSPTKNAFGGVVAVIVVGYVAYRIVRGAPSGSIIGGIRDWVGGLVQE